MWRVAIETRQPFSPQKDSAFLSAVVNAPPPSPDPVWNSVGLVLVAIAVAGVLGPAGSAGVPPQSHGPMGEHRHAFGDAPAGSERQASAETG